MATAAFTTAIATPIGDRLIVSRDVAQDVTPGGVILPDAARDKPCRGVVVAVGQGRILDDGTRMKMEVREGNTVVFSSYGGTEVEIGGKPYIVLREADVLFVE